MGDHFVLQLAAARDGLFFTQSMGHYAEGLAFVAFAAPGTPSAGPAPPAPSAAAPGDFASGAYANVKFGYRVNVPPGLLARPEASNGAGRYFYSADGQIYLKAWGGALAGNTPDLDALFAKESAPSDGKTVTYHSRGSDSFVVSGRAGANIFYERFVAKNGRYAEAIVTYPNALRKQWDKVAASAAASLALQ
jgi:hypothetical protein